MKGPLRHRAFAVFVTSRVLSVLAVQMVSVAIDWQVYTRTHSTLALAFSGLSKFLPVALLSPIAGDVADRFDRRAVLASCYAVFACCAGLFAWLAVHPELGTTPIYGVLLLFGVARAFAGPAGQALVPALVPADELGKAVAWASASFEISTIVGPSLGGFLIDAGGESLVHRIAALGFAVVVVLLATMRYSPEKYEHTGTGWTRLLAGVSYVRGNRIILGALSLDLFAVLLGGAVALMPVFARDILHIGERGLGFLRSAPAIGAGLMALFLASRPLGANAGKKMFVGVALFGAATVVFGLSKSPWVSFAALVVLGAADMVSVVVRQTIVQLATPPSMRGRVSAVNLVFVGASNELGEFESGLTASWFGTVPAVVIGGIGTMLVTGVFALLFPELRRFDRLDTLTGDSSRPSDAKEPKSEPPR